MNLLNLLNFAIPPNPKLPQALPEAGCTGRALVSSGGSSVCDQLVFEGEPTWDILTCQAVSTIGSSKLHMLSTDQSLIPPILMLVVPAEEEKRMIKAPKMEPMMMPINASVFKDEPDWATPG